MTPEQMAAIERLRELDRRVGYWQWGQDEQFSHHVLYDDGFCFSVCETESADALPTHADFIVTLRNEALPLIEALQAENERLRDLLKDACTALGRMTLLRDKFYCEMETAQTETVFAKRERDALQARIDGALAALQRKPKLGESTWRALDQGLVYAIKILTGEGEA